jgi:hypothetical protein
MVLWLWQLPQRRATYWLLLPLLGLWAAAGLASWPVWTGVALLVTAVLQMGVWPLAGWRALRADLPQPLLILLLTLLPLNGLAVLVRFPEAAQAGMAYGLLVTALGLLGVLLGLRQAWGQLAQPMSVVAGLAQVQMNIALLTAVWGGRAAGLAEARVLLAIAIVGLAAGRVQARWRLIGPLVALAALAGLPLMAGFAGRAALYTVWWQNGRFLLVLLLALMHIPLITAGLWLIWRQTAEESPSILATVSWFLPVVGLLSVAGWRDTPVVVWLALLLPALIGVVALRFEAALLEARAILRRAFMFAWPRDWVRQTPTAVLANVGTALREAARILEGEGGLLWLLVFVVILLLVR